MKITGEFKIEIQKDQFDKCSAFALKSAKSQRQIEFGSTDTRPRPILELSRDNLIGKLAEVAFATFLQDKFDIATELDFDIYPRGVWDKDDFCLNGHQVDIKATRTGGKWLLVELNKLEFRKRENKIPDYFLFAVTGWDRNSDSPTGAVILKGYASISQICRIEQIGIRTSAVCDGIPNTQFIPKNGFIPGTQTRLQADNCARPVYYLEKDWSKLIDLTTKGSR